MGDWGRAGGGRAAAGTSFARLGGRAPGAPGGARTEGTGGAHRGHGGAHWGRGVYWEGAHSEGARGDGAGCWMLSQIRNRGHSANARGLLEGI